jgi:nucleotide-binding universal stress UspA family protein
MKATMTEKLNCILVPSDFSEPALHALRYAGELARELNARLILLYADPFVPPIDYSATVGGWDEESFEYQKVCAEEQLRIDAKANLDPTVSYDVVVRVAMPLAGILDQAAESSAGLIVMGTHGRSGFRRLIIGSVTEAVMRHAEVPVIAVPPRGAVKPSIRTVVCPVVYKAQCRDALPFAAGIGAPDARFIVISANPDEEMERDDYLAALRAWIPEAIAARCDVQTIGDEHAVNPIEGFAKSTHADLIVAAEPANRTAADVLRGTFAARLLQHSECPVLTVNAPAAKVAARHARHEAPAMAHQ